MWEAPVNARDLAASGGGWVGQPDGSGGGQPAAAGGGGGGGTGSKAGGAAEAGALGLTRASSFHQLTKTLR